MNFKTHELQLQLVGFVDSYFEKILLKRGFMERG